MSQPRNEAAKAGIGLGTAIAVAISWSVNKSILWAVLHGIFLPSLAISSAGSPVAVIELQLRVSLRAARSTRRSPAAVLVMASGIRDQPLPTVSIDPTPGVGVGRPMGRRNPRQLAAVMITIAKIAATANHFLVAAIVLSPSAAGRPPYGKAGRFFLILA